MGTLEVFLFGCIKRLFKQTVLQFYFSWTQTKGSLSFWIFYPDNLVQGFMPHVSSVIQDFKEADVVNEFKS